MSTFATTIGHAFYSASFSSHTENFKVYFTVFKVSCVVDFVFFVLLLFTFGFVLFDLVWFGFLLLLLLFEFSNFLEGL